MIVGRIFAVETGGRSWCDGEVRMTLTRIADCLDGSDRQILASCSDLDEVVEACTRTLRPHALRIRDRGARLATRLAHLEAGPMSLNRLRYGAEVAVEPAAPEEDTFLISLPLAGRAIFAYGALAAEARPGQGVVVGPYERFRFEIDSDFDQLVLRLGRQRVEEVARDLWGTGSSVRVDLPLSLGEPTAFLVGLLETATNVPQLVGSVGDSRLGTRLEELIIETLLLPHSARIASDDGGRARSCPSRHVRSAQGYMLAHLGEPISLASVARHCGVSLRALQMAFRRELDATPGTWLRVQRLERAYGDLLSAAQPDTTVTEVALRYGFFHLGEFSAAFKSRFGVAPSAVLAGKR
ncbi:AraC family transcriptional regulator [Sinomonas sp. ASV322]|uniref:AraC family transcriptional regulator n=1 Tax=Sinomonas sp. ASV322 TaxID=3041920 RepID=UPI0027DDC1A7|nr:AraC family transcriptional regulator [Sinomonas sp. ASV322]MDQ4504366.1 AraC family transcriptional regulator [Sinomonas sp. ASV322]